MLIIISEEILMMGSIGLGLLYAARGFGTGIGPIIGRRLFRDEKDWVMVMGIAIFTSGVMYVMVGFADAIWVMILFVLLAHTASGANWVKAPCFYKSEPSMYSEEEYSPQNGCYLPL